ncbi:alpha/beta hydrolase [Streptomyces zaomyceticus]|uniref:alpha/beta hydrolase n=1 Tax=Streptomyces zaomyceticus TaxID=68286 RepID=UPI00343562ED
MPTWQQLRDAKLDEYADAADGWGKVSSRANTDKDRVDNGMFAKVHHTQKGEAATKAGGDIQQLSRNYQYLHTECGLIRTALNGLATELASPQKKLKQALEDAENLRFTVKPDGSVEYPTDSLVLSPGTNTAEHGAPVPLAPGKGEGVGSADANKGKAEDIAERIGDAVREAAEIDGRYAAALRGLKADPGLAVSDETLADAAEDTTAMQRAAGKYADGDQIPHGKSPTENADWWKGLSQEQRDEYATLYPASVGALDGLPATVRDDANRMVLAETRAQTQLELNAIPKPPQQYLPNPGGSYPAVVTNPAYREWEEKYGDRKPELERIKRGIDAVEKRFDSTGKDGLPEAYLLGFDPRTNNGDGRIIVANGNPDTAAHTAAYVPGTGTEIGDIGGDLERANGLWVASHQQSKGADVSTIMWFDYDAPRSAYPTDKGDAFPEAARNQYAEQGAPTLHAFMEGTRASHEGASGSPGHTTIIGHSYGSTLIGEATKAGRIFDGPIADDIVVAGSPGMQVDRAADLGIKGDHVWAMVAEEDNVPTGGSLVGLGDDWVVPTDPEFGGNVMKTDTIGHSGYWDDNSLSLNNQAKVIVGDYEGVILE